MEWLIAGAAVLIIVVFFLGMRRSLSASRPGARSDRHGDGTGAAIATGVIVAGAAGAHSDDEPVDGGGSDGGSADPGTSVGGWGGGDGGGGDGDGGRLTA